MTIPINDSASVWQDPRSEEGELLCKERFDGDFVKNKKQEMGSYLYAGQFQQRPAPAEGGIIKKNWFNWWKKPYLPEITFTIQSWDTALTANELSAYSACTTWGVFINDYGIENVILLSMWRGKVEYPELRERARRLYVDYRDTAQKDTRLTGKKPDACIIEAKASGSPLIQDLRRAGISSSCI